MTSTIDTFTNDISLINVSFAICTAQIAAKPWTWVLYKGDFDPFSDRDIMNRWWRNSTVPWCLVFLFSFNLKPFLGTIRATRSYSVCNWCVTRQRWRGAIRYYISVRWDLRWFRKTRGPSARWRTYKISIAVAMRNIELKVLVIKTMHNTLNKIQNSLFKKYEYLCQ